jgi:ligand-binding SRPBCC domain-containing protein
MSDHLLETSLHLSVARPTAFAFFANAANLEAITPPELRFRITTPLPIVMEQGTIIEYSLSLRGIPFRWRTRIAVWEPPHRFVDLQEQGPYALWEHTHTFTDAADGGTLVRDHVRYRLPLGPLGEIAYPLVRRDLTRIFGYREVRVRYLLTDSSVTGVTTEQEGEGSW